MDGTIQKYTLDMADGTAPKPLIVKQGDTNSREARISLTAFKEPWTIPFGCQIHINVRKNDMTYANATCTQENEHTVLAPITEQMTTVPGTQLGELFFLGTDGDIRSQTFPLVVWDAVSDLDLEASSNDFQALKAALRDVKISTDAAGIATQYATEQGNAAGMAAQRAEDAADSIQVAVDAAAAAKDCESNARDSELAAAQTQQEVTDYVEAQKAAFVGYSKRESDSKYANAITATAEGEGGVTVEDAWTAPVLDMEVAGRSEQVVTTGKNLLEKKLYMARWQASIPNIQYFQEATLPYSPEGESLGVARIAQCQKGITYTFSVTDPNANCSLGLAEYNNFESAGEYTKNVGYVNAGKTSAPITYTAKSDGILVCLVAGTWSDGKTLIHTCTETELLQCEEGTTATSWEPYTGGVPSPSPDYPQDIISTGTVSTGAQLLDLPDTSGTVGGIKYSFKNGEITATGTPDTQYNNIFWYRLTLSPGEYYISGGDVSAGNMYAQVAIDKDGVRKNYVNRSFSVTGDETAMSLNIQNGASTASISYTFKPMLNAGDQPLPWEPYTGGKSAPSVEYPQTLEVRATGAQLFFKNLVTLQGTCAEADITDKRAIKISCTGVAGGKYVGFAFADKSNIIGKTLTISYGGIISSSPKLTPAIRLYWLDDTDAIVSYVLYVNTSPTTTTIADPQNDKATKLALLLYTDVGNVAEVNDYVIYKDIMINAGDTALPWEPYKGYQSASITLTEPLRGIGDYQDRIMCRDGVWGVERWIAEEAIHITATVALSNGKMAGVCDKHASTNGKGVFCSNANKTVNSDRISYGQFYENPINIVLVGNEGDTRQTLQEKYGDGYFTYVLDTPTWEPFDDATQQALNALTTYAGTTHLTITAGGTTPTVTLDYVKDTHKALKQCQEAAKEYTDNQIAAIVAALPTATQAAIVDNQTTRLLQEV